MAGYIFSIKKPKKKKIQPADNPYLQFCINNGVYSTIQKPPSNRKGWLTAHEGTFADYLSMKPGDNIYFFSDRKIFGIGKLTSVDTDTKECKYLNYPKSLEPEVQRYNDIKGKMVLNKKENINNRIVCTFEPSPYFFINGVDMDDILSFKPERFRMLRAFWKLSFIKIDDEENKALRDIILKRNEEYIYSQKNVFSFKKDVHNKINNIMDYNYKVSSKDILKYSSKEDFIKHEMAVEAGIIDVLSSDEKNIFGHWDYISHQVIASPFKPIDYMDKIDIFGYRYIMGFDTISKYLLIEIKKDTATKDAVDQTMKYVDWINQEYAAGDYSMIEAFIVAYDFPKKVIDYKNEICVRNYTKGRRPIVSDKWMNVRLIKYSYDVNTETLKFVEVK
ncbi:hypothetical protein [Dethiothermospora halolimnae]|uniref:hypothetical protein n=1 Tax=Dethiothermospora halolimnae TaxID=3114390 RepID=UPI003CCBA7B1